MARILLACIVGKVPTGVITCVKAVLDFVYLAQYKAHDTDTLQYLEDALETFQKNQHIFIELEIHPTLNIPKFHALRHYLDSIKLFGTTDNYNTEMFERFHIDFAKEGFRASNKRDVFPQMIVWLSRREKVSMFSNYLDLIDSPITFNPRPKSLQSRNAITIAKHPPYKKHKLATIEQYHNAPNFSQDLSHFLNHFLQLPGSDSMATQYILPFAGLDVFTQFKFHPNSLQENVNDIEGMEENDTIKALPSGLKNKAAQFNMVVAITSDDAESTGIEGLYWFQYSFPIISLICALGTRIGRVRVIFQLPLILSISNNQSMEAPPAWPKEHLAYVEWYQPLAANPDKVNGMYSVRRTQTLQCSIISLRSIRQGCMLVPKFFDGWITKKWTTDNVLDSADSFLLNNFHSPYAYQTLW